MEEKAITIKDIAKQLGISANAVSRALRDKADISEETKQKVFKKAKELGYKKNYLASTLRTRRSNTVGLILPNIVNQFFAEMYLGVEEICRKHGYSILISTSNETYEDEKRAINNMANHQVDGIIICPSIDSRSNTERLKNLGIPFIFIGRDSADSDVCSFFCPDFMGGYLACQELIGAGCHKPACLTLPLDIIPSRERVEGMKKCMTDNGLDPNSLAVTCCGAQRNEAYTAIKEWFEKGFDGDGLFVFEDDMAIEIIRYCNDAGIPIPDRIPVIGYNNIRLDSLVTPTLSSVSIFGIQSARDGATALIKMINGEKPEKTKNVIEPKTVRRKSTSR